jgi:hypothetical protein
VKHLLMHPAFPDIVGEWALEEISDEARVWTVTRGADGKLAEELDLSLLLKLNPNHSAAQIADALVLAAAAADIAETRVW